MLYLSILAIPDWIDKNSSMELILLEMIRTVCPTKNNILPGMTRRSQKEVLVGNMTIYMWETPIYDQVWAWA